jgi:biotin carboxyl carrier protein
VRRAFRDGERVREVEVVPLGSGRWRVVVDGAAMELAAEPLGPGRFRLLGPDGVVTAEVTAAGARRFVRLGAMDFVLEAEAGGRARARGPAGGGLEAPMPGVVTRVLVSAGDDVRRGQPLIAIEAMKMEHLVRAPRDGRVRRVAARAGETVNGGAALVELEEPVAAGGGA